MPGLKLVAFENLLSSLVRLMEKFVKIGLTSDVDFACDRVTRLDWFDLCSDILSLHFWRWDFTKLNDTRAL